MVAAPCTNLTAGCARWRVRQHIRPTAGGRPPSTTRAVAADAAATDPEARLYRKGKGKEAKVSSIGNALTENRHGLVVEAEHRRREPSNARAQTMIVIRWDRDASRSAPRSAPTSLRCARIHRRSARPQRHAAHLGNRGLNDAASGQTTQHNASDRPGDEVITFVARNLRFFCSRLRSGLLVARFATHASTRKVQRIRIMA